MVVEESCNISEKLVDFTQEQGNGTSSSSSDKHLSKYYLSKRLKLATFWEVASGGQQSYIFDFVVYLTFPSSS